ncbi:AraC family transcriptional regulator [Zobellella sp. DQSA1]|uniref:AraC family transcriptional regulator n=1 Tax=Zobellella sp. DQSA1 TaxID=3342386 RepID=UPI0035C11907
MTNIDVLCREYQCGQATGTHCHGRGQLVYVQRGGGLLRCDGQACFVLAGQLLWLPAELEHDFRVMRDSLLLLLYCPAGQVHGLPSSVARLELSPLLAQLFEERVRRAPAPDLVDAYNRVLLDQLAGLSPSQAPFFSGAGLDPRLFAVVEALCRRPDIRAGLMELGRHSGAAPRTLQRLFHRAFGCSFRRWRQRLVMEKALQLSRQGLSHTRIALELGYGSLAAFSSAFNAFLRERDQ